MRAVLLALALLLPAAMSVAQPADPMMEEQRCIWRCQARAGGTGPVYDACVRRSCTSAATGSRREAPPAGGRRKERPHPPRHGALGGHDAATRHLLATVAAQLIPRKAASRRAY